jgi:MFS family permease
LFSFPQQTLDVNCAYEFAGLLEGSGVRLIFEVLNGRVRAYIRVHHGIGEMKLLSNLKGRYAFIRGNFLILLISWVLMFFSGPIPSTYSSLYFKGLGANDLTIGVIGFAGSMALALVQFPGGLLADQHGRRWLVVTMTFGVTFSVVFFIFAPSWHFIVLGTAIQNFCLLYQPALFAIMIDSVSPEHRGAGFTLQSVITNLVSLPAVLIAGYLVLTFDLDLGTRIAYGLVLIFYLIAALLRTKLKETLPSNNSTSRPDLLKAFKEYPKAVKEGLQVWKKVPEATLYLFGVNASLNSIIAGCNIFFVIYATNVLQVTKFQWAIVMAFMFLSSAIPAVLAGWRMDAVGRKRFYLLGFLLYLPAMVIFLEANFAMMLVSFFLFGLGQMLQNTSYNSILGDLTPRELRGKVIGCGQFFMYIGQAFAQLLVAALYTYVAPRLPFILLACGVIPLLAVAFLKIHEPSTRQV